MTAGVPVTDEQTAHKSPRAALVTARSDASARYRCGHAREQLELAGVRAEVASILDTDLAERVRECPVVIFHRVGLDRFVEGLYRRVRGDGGLVVYDTDDLVFDAEARLAVRHRLYGADTVRAAWVREDATALREAMEGADAVLVSTEYLADQVRRLGRPAWVHRNGFSLEMLRLSEDARAQRGRARDAVATAGARGAEGRRERGRIVIGYASGTPTHDGDFPVAKPALLRLLGARGDVELWLVGPVDPGEGWGSARDRVRRIPLVPWPDLPRLLAQFDINIAPLDCSKRACRAKSEAKYIEAGLVAVPTVASAGAGFDWAIRSGDNGLLASSVEDWAAHLELLVGDPERRRRVGERAYADVLARYHPAVRGRELVATLNSVGTTLRGHALWPDLASGPAPVGTGEASGRWTPAHAARGRTRAPLRTQQGAGRGGALLVRRGLYSLRHRGLRTLLMELWIYARGWWRGLRGLPGA